MTTEKKFKGTPGPWIAKTDYPTYGQLGSFKVEANEPPYGLVICERGSYHERAKEMAANARLIAAAPELLEALEAQRAASQASWWADNCQQAADKDKNNKSLREGALEAAAEADRLADIALGLRDSAIAKALGDE